MVHTVKLRTPDHVRFIKIVKNPELSWSGNLLVRICWSESYVCRRLAGPKVIDVRLGNLVYEDEMCC